MPLLKINDDLSDGSPRKQSSSKIDWLAVAEVTLTVIFFALIVGQAAPDVNESHYLTKAKHYWNPSYCEGDIFLSSSFSHLAFYATTGWLTKFVSLSTYAWIGRFAAWTLIAIGWRRVCRQLFDFPMMAVLSAVFFVLLNQRFHLAGEWVVGGFEGKSISYGFVLLGISFMLERRWRWVWPLLGVASMFHVLVGGWTTVAALAAFLLSDSYDERQIVGTSSSIAGATTVSRILYRLFRQMVPLLIGLTIALVGILPPLLSGSDGQLQQTANAIYVSQRISHHLDFGAFPILHVSRFVLMTIVWWNFSRLVRMRQPLDVETKSRLKLLENFTTVTLLISLAGLVFSGMSERGGEAAAFAHQFLRFYLFRLSDFAVPASLALISGTLISRWVINRADFPRQVCAAIFIGCIATAGGVLALENHADGRPNADARSLPNDPENKERTDAIFRNWKRACEWVSNNTPPDAVFITPAQQQTFKWYAGRSEVCCWKDVPQDPAAMVQWKQRIDKLTAPQRTSDLGIFIYSDQQLKAMAEKYGATHLINRPNQIS